MSDLFIERLCTAISPDGRTLSTRIGITKPGKVNDHAWVCGIDYGGIDSNTEAMGVDSWQAIQTAMQLVYIHLTIQKSLGWTFRFFDEEEADPFTLLPLMGQTQPAPLY